MTKEYEPLIEALKKHVEQQDQEVSSLLNNIDELTQVISAPRRTRAVRDEHGNIIGSESIVAE